MADGQRLVLWAPVDRVSTDALQAAIAAGDVAATVLPGAGPHHPAVALCQAAGVAAFLTAPSAAGADGIHAVGDFATRCATVRSGDVPVGAAAVTRHEAMELGEAGAAYIWFGTPDVPESGCRDLAAWWTPLFEIPAVASGAATIEDLAALVATGAEFVAIGPALLATAERAAAAAAHAQSLIDARVAA